ncbi:dihydropteroate synthase [Shewanella sp. SR44-3]|uniref:dihydropteroate synthase n=1 Tax=Shewanella sp. SR44-3 TaxID=2760936 RepID=UPI0015FBB539|nr:dihydropteroate synthase [Shewanella sp. SR44-3]MBB1270064.1 dihydropteroate synthase [Shewanella sp. SR44-3]
MFELKSKNKSLDLSAPLVMGIVNVTPDSFSDGGQFANFDAACAHVDKLVAQGAKILDIGGESTRPGAAEVSLADELARVIPVIEYAAQKYAGTGGGIWLSIDTSKPEVMAAAVNAGADMINDVRALQLPGALEMAANLNVPVCLMHMKGEPKDMQEAPEYQDIIQEVSDFFDVRVDACMAAGIERGNILLDPGFGFGKTLEHNYQLLAQLPALHAFHLPILIGLSRKRMIGELLQRDVTERLAGSLAGALIAAQQGARILRVHDVAETRDVLSVMSATMACS